MLGGDQVPVEVLIIKEQETAIHEGNIKDASLKRCSYRDVDGLEAQSLPQAQSTLYNEKTVCQHLIVKKRVTLTFPKRSVQMPVTYRLAKDYNVAANIIRAQVAPNQIGKLVVELSGDIDQLDAALDWMRSQDIGVSFASREIMIDEDTCVHCGLCTGVCPTEALTLDPQSFKLTFTRSRCIVCEQCIPTCPVQAISTNF